MVSRRDALAGLTSPNGELDRPLASAGWPVPAKVEADGTHLRWRSVKKPGNATAAPDLLERFLRLASGDRDELVAFASSHGPLQWPFDDAGLQAQSFAERISTWRSLSRIARGVLDVAQHVRLNEKPPPAAWKALAPLKVEERSKYLAVSFREVGPLSWPFPMALAEPQQAVGLVLAAWLAGVRVQVAWSSRRAPELVLLPGSVVGAVGLALSLAVSSSGGFAVCSECGVPFVPSRRPVAGRRRFCARCREIRAPQRAAEADYRSRRRGVAIAVANDGG